MLKFSVQTFYQPLFNNSFPFNNFSLFPLAFSLQQFFSHQQFFSSIILFPSKSFPHQKAHSKSFFPIFKGKKPPKQKAKSQAKSPKAQSKAPLPPSGVFYSSKQGGATGRGITL
jgi:hypothetical protein